MKKKINIITSLIYILLSLFIVFSGLYILNALPQKMQAKADAVFDRLDIPVYRKNPVNVIPTPAVNKTKTLMDQGLRGIYWNLNTDLTGGVSEFFTESTNYLDYFNNFLPNALFIRPDILGEYADLTDANGTKTDALQWILSSSNSETYRYQMLYADREFLSSGDIGQVLDAIDHYVKNYGFHGVLLSTDILSENGILYSTVIELGKRLNTLAPGFYIGLETEHSNETVCSQEVRQLLTEELVDFVVIKSNASTRTSPSFSSVIKMWNDFAAEYSNTRFYCLHNISKIGTAGSAWSSYNEGYDQMNALWDHENISGSIFDSALALRKNISQCAQRIAWLLDDGKNDELVITSVSVNSQKNTVTFRGLSALGHKLYCNHKVIGTGGGSFTKEIPLSIGSNAFTFSSLGKEITYRVHNNAHIIHSCYPSGDINADKNETITVLAACMNGCEVSCALNGAAYRMYPTTDYTLDDLPEGYSVYACELSFSENSFTDIDLGKLQIGAVLGDNKESITGGRVTLLKSNSSSLLNKLLGFIYSAMYGESGSVAEQPQYTDYTQTFETVSPYKDNGLGTSLMCRIIEDDTEVLGTPGEYNTYHADHSALCAGTLDYVERMTESDEGYLRYDLRSGLSVYGVNCELINNAFTLPKNHCFVKRVDDTDPNSTDIILKNDWLPPITVKAAPQSYRIGYLNYYYNISQLTCEYVDVTIRYSDFYDASLLQFSEASPFSNYEIFTDGADGVILRLHLKKNGQYYGFDLYQNQNGETVLSFQKHSNGDVAGKVIMLDPGHGGLAMTGTAVLDQSIAEKQVTLNIALKVKSILESRGATVLMTRQSDIPLTLNARRKIMGSYSPNLFLSIHCDGSDYTSEAGTHTFYFTPYSQPLAKAIHNSLVGVYKNYIYSPTEPNYSLIDKGIKFYPFYVTRINNCPSVLIETGFMTNATEGQVLCNDTCRSYIAQAIANGVGDYFAVNH